MLRNLILTIYRDKFCPKKSYQHLLRLNLETSSLEKTIKAVLFFNMLRLGAHRENFYVLKKSTNFI